MPKLVLVALDRNPARADGVEWRIPVPRCVTKGRFDGRRSERTIATGPARAGSAWERGGRVVRASRRHRALRLAVSLVLLLSTAGVVFGWWIWNVFQVRTTNAYVVGNITPFPLKSAGRLLRYTRTTT